MNVRFRTILLSAAISLFFVSVAHANNGNDYPLVPRYPGSSLRYSHTSEYEEYVLPLAPLDRGNVSEAIHLEGKVTYLQYHVDDRSTREVYRSYQSSLRRAGFEILFEHDSRSFLDTYRWVAAVYQPHGLVWKSTSGSQWFTGDGFRYLAARHSSRSGDAYVTVYTTPRHGGGVTLQIDIIEKADMQGGVTTVTADHIAGEILRLGFVAIHDVHFAPDSDEILEESSSALSEIAAFLNENADMAFYVVGHTTIVGDHDYLVDLSQRRAEAMVSKLVDEYDVAEGMLHPAGVGPLSPVAINETPTGQELNQRIELVLRPPS